ncbi:spore protein YkvP [Paenibacillus baekrokdamisoli]|uniref:Spore protein YkvP n=1 Tax=Paenibacillus baekrokdamisoli TaxID=1712516 RepID=A0A3G9JJ47_9BACL|nr:glycosyltransferase [Paenibacillus baekrokdamisoli]MBB3069413.1 spore maturation protein CgeB [Paenibacillus baekrokdamisoli]BBH25013.1 spore protein YkvP [Paenibacillus baekrokdamisoli]
MKILALVEGEHHRLNFCWALEELGHQVYYLNEITEQLFDDAVRDFKPDMTFGMGWDFLQSRTDILPQIKARHNLFHLYFAEEDWLHYIGLSKPYVSTVQTHFVLSRSYNCVPKYKEMGINATYLDVGSNPSFHRPLKPVPHYQCDVSVVVNGQFIYDIFRRKSLSDLVYPLFDAPFDTRIRGRDWDTELPRNIGITANPKMLYGILPYQETPLVHNSAKINISVQTVEDQLSSRTYDILASGGFLLTSDSPGVRARLKPGINCVVSNSPEETIELIKYYLKHEGKREDIARKGREFACTEGSYVTNIPRVWPMIEEEMNRYYGR